MQNATALPLLTAARLRAAPSAPRGTLLSPWLAADTAALVTGPPGIGKSFFALGVAWAVASGGRFLGWETPRPRRVLYVDGEMGAAELRDRLALFGPMPETLSVLPHDGGAQLDLGEEDGILRLMSDWNDPALLVLDTLGALAPADNDPARRDRFRAFLLHLRKSRRAVLMVDPVNAHNHKQGPLTGAADLVMALRPASAGPVLATARGNARFEVQFEKTRQRVPVMPLLAELQTVDGTGTWRCNVGGGRVERLAWLVRQGLSRRDVCEALGIERSWFFRLKAEARERGLLPPKGLS